MSGAGVYEGLRIVELGAGAPAALVTRFFAEQGAAVLRVESTRGPDGTPRPPAGPAGSEAARALARIGVGTRSVALDLGTAEGVALAQRLVDRADVVVDGLGPGGLPPGLAPAALLARRPELIVLSSDAIPGNGSRGAVDPLSSRHAATLLAVALLAREASGRGRHLDGGRVEAGARALAELVASGVGAGEPLAPVDGCDAGAAPDGVYPCDGDDAWIAIGARDEAEWEALVAAMGDPGWARAARFSSGAGRLAHADELDERIAAWTRDFAPYELMAGLQEAHVPAGVVQTPAMLLRDPQLAHRGHFVRVEHPALGPLLVERSGFRLSEHPGGYTGAGSARGGHGDAVLREELGLAADEIAALRWRGVLG